MAAKPALGLYLTDQFIQMGMVSGDGEKLSHFHQAVLPAGIIVNGEIKNKVELVRQIQEAKKQLGTGNGAETVIGVGDNRVFLREFTVPKLPGKNIDDAIDWQIRSLLPVLPAEVETDWKLIGRDANDQIEVLLAAIPKTVINAYIVAAQEAGLEVVDLEPAVFANIRVINPEQLKGKNQLLVYLTEDYAEISYLTNGIPRLTDYLPAADVKKRGDIVKIITDYISFVNSKHPYRQISEVVLSGDNPNSANLVAHLTQANIVTVEAQPRLKQKGTPNHLLVTAAGLSLKPAIEEKSLKLLPLEMRLIEQSVRLENYWQIALMVLVALSSIFVGWLGLNYLSLRGQLSSLRAQQLELTANVSPEDKTVLSDNIRGLNSLADQLDIITQVTGGEDLVLFELATAVPEGVALGSLVYTRDISSLTLSDPQSSWIVTGVANSRPLVLQFYDRLISQPTFPNGRLYYGSLEREVGVDFRVAGSPRRQK
jgi:Tfp pilus assembly PilM family ATPase